MFLYKNIDVQYSYSHVIKYNPLIETYVNKKKTECNLNRFDDINGNSKVDASQVSWRKTCYSIGKCVFPYPKTNALDAVLYQQFYDKYGYCIYNGLDGQYKAFHEKQLGVTNSYDNIN